MSKLDSISEQKLMKISETKTKAMIFDFTKHSQFTTRLELKNLNIDFVKEMKLLGTTISNDLSWNTNTENIVKKVYLRMQLLRKCQECFRVI